IRPAHRDFLIDERFASSTATVPSTSCAALSPFLEVSGNRQGGPASTPATSPAAASLVRPGEACACSVAVPLHGPGGQWPEAVSVSMEPIGGAGFGRAKTCGKTGDAAGGVK